MRCTRRPSSSRRRAVAAARHEHTLDARRMQRALLPGPLHCRAWAFLDTLDGLEHLFSLRSFPFDSYASSELISPGHTCWRWLARMASRQMHVTWLRPICGGGNTANENALVLLMLYCRGLSARVWRVHRRRRHFTRGKMLLTRTTHAAALMMLRFCWLDERHDDAGAYAAEIPAILYRCASFTHGLGFDAHDTGRAWRQHFAC